MSMHHRGIGRGIIGGVRADASDAKAVFAELRTTVEAFIKAQSEELAGIKKNFADVVTTEKVERINAEVGRLQSSLDDINRTIAALRQGGGGSTVPDAAKAEHRSAFHRFFREGTGADALGDLAVKAGLTTQSKPDGGYLVPTEMESTIDRVLGTVSVIRSLARVVNISTGSYTKVVNVGGTGSGWVGEEESRTETATPSLRELEFPVMEIYAEPYATQVMLDDGRVDIEAWLADEVQIEFAEKEGAAFATGSGVKRPRGITAYTTVANASYAWGSIGYIASGAASTFITPTSSASPADCLIDLYHALKQGYRNNATWLMSDATLAPVRKFKDGQGNFIWSPPSAAEGPSTILGKPAYGDDNMPAVGAGNLPIAFGDFNRAYLIVDRGGIRVLRNPYKTNGKVAFYTTKRVGGGIQNYEAIKLLKIATS